MAVAFIFQAGTLDQAGYDGVMEDLTKRSGGSFAGPGFLAHLAGPAPTGGWQVIDVWESEEAANGFYGSDAFGAVREGTADAGLEMTPWPLHRVEVFGAFSQTT
jgi:hypothetical protein